MKIEFTMHIGMSVHRSTLFAHTPWAKPGTHEGLLILNGEQVIPARLELTGCVVETGEEVKLNFLPTEIDTWDGAPVGSILESGRTATLPFVVEGLTILDSSCGDESLHLAVNTQSEGDWVFLS